MDSDNEYDSEDGCSPVEEEERSSPADLSDPDINYSTWAISTGVDLDDEISKARAVQNQLALWEQLLAARIRLQRILQSVNQLPQTESVWSEFLLSRLDNDESSPSSTMKKFAEIKRRSKALIDTLLYLQSNLWRTNDSTKCLISSDGENVTVHDEDEEILSSASENEEDNDNMKKNTENFFSQKNECKLTKFADYPALFEHRSKAFNVYRDKILLHWYEKTKLASGKIGGKNDFSAFDKNILQQIKQILSDKNRLLKRTRLKRTGFTVLGKSQATKPVDESDHQQNDDADFSDYDEEIFDDDDFYHQLLRDFIERKTVGVSDSHALSRQWLEVQKLRNKARKKLVDRKASKARKIRYDVMPKLVNFMAPVDYATSMETRNELFKSLFNKKTAAT